jgi:hypothetical protein
MDGARKRWKEKATGTFRIFCSFMDNEVARTDKPGMAISKIVVEFD